MNRPGKSGQPHSAALTGGMPSSSTYASSDQLKQGQRQRTGLQEAQLTTVLGIARKGRKRWQGTGKGWRGSGRGTLFEMFARVLNPEKELGKKMLLRGNPICEFSVHFIRTIIIELCIKYIDLAHYQICMTPLCRKQNQHVQQKIPVTPPECQCYYLVLLELHP
jgi:hypothetical protein